MKLETRPAPHIRYRESTRTVMGDAVLVLLILYAMAFFYYGWRASALGAFSVAVTYCADMLCVLAAGKRPNLRDLSPLVTGMLIPLFMPASIPYGAVAVAAVVAIVAAKHPFGGVGHNVFNPAAAGLAFATICYSEAMFSYPLPLQKLPVILGETEVTGGVSAAFTLMLGGVPKDELLDMALGNFAGPMGATNILVILACLLYLVFRNTVRWEMPAAFFATVSLYAFCFPRVRAGRLESVALELVSGMLLLGGVMMLGDPVTTPKRDLSKVAYGVVSGVMVMLFRSFGNLEEGFPFAILLMNAAVWGFDMLGERVYSILRRRGREAVGDKKIPKKT